MNIMEDKRYDIVCKKARKRIKGIECNFLWVGVLGATLWIIHA